MTENVKGKIIKAEPRHIKDIVRLTDEYIAENYYSEEYLLQSMKKDNYDIYIYVNDEDEVMAYLYIFSDTYRNALEAMYIEDENLEIEGIDDDTMVGVYKTAITDKKYRKTGILTEFLEELEQYVTEHGERMIMFTALQHPDGKIPVDTVVSAAGFRQIKTILHPWIEIEDIACPYCGKEHCECNAVVYIKMTGGKKGE